MNQVPENYILVNNHIGPYSKKYPVNATAQKEQVQDKNKTVTGRRRNTIKTSSE